ncbi:MAG TPA: ATP-binding protein [Nitrososphaeraceae archaeon]|nr:ATP-binding protein [Nitrososphaeraceae archaeon]
MMHHRTNLFGLIRSKIALKIGILLVIQIVFIVTSFTILSYYESQQTFLGNSINIAGKNRFLTSNLMFQVSDYFLRGNNNSNLSLIQSAIKQLESNILLIKQGGNLSDIDLRPLPSEFLNDWNRVYQKSLSLKSILTTNVIKPNENIKSVAAPNIDRFPVKSALVTQAVSLVNSSDTLAKELGQHARESSQKSIYLQRVFAVLNIGVAAIVLYLVMNILKPIFALTAATSEVKKGNLEVSVKSKGKDELSVLSESFNSMVNSLRNYIKKQNELREQVEKANEELKYKDRLKDEFINVAAHELKGPIQPILGLSELLRRRKAIDGGTNNNNNNNNKISEMTVQEEREFLDVIVRNSRRLREFAENILDVAKIESGSLVLSKEKINLEDMINEVLKEFAQNTINKDKIKISYEYQDINTIIIVGDRSKLHQVIYNLVSNAIKFIQDEGTVIVSVTRKKHDYGTNNDYSAVVSIKDTGSGIDPDILPRLFTKFSTKSETGGTGLGLFISKSIVEAHGGRIWAENNRDGSKGATFAFSLPALPYKNGEPLDS